MKNYLPALLLIFLLTVSCQQEDVVPVSPQPQQPSVMTGTVEDNEGNEYNTVVIGNQEWMAENLRTTTYCNGDPITLGTPEAWGPLVQEGFWGYLFDDAQYDSIYGKLYNWYAVDDQRNVCPCGWHVPSDLEWTVLTDYLGGETWAGGKMKSIETQSPPAQPPNWETPNEGATNESGFSGLPAGTRGNEGPIWFNSGRYAYWWSSTENINAFGQPTSLAYVRIVFWLVPGCLRVPDHKSEGFSIRCLKD